MTYTRPRTLVVITLLQLCRAEISDTLPEWYSANVIHDGFQPKPLSELFSTPPPAFSTINPIVVLSNSSPASNEVAFFSTVPPPKTSNTGSTSDIFTTFPLLQSTSTPLQTLAPQTISTVNIQPQPVQYQDTQPPIPAYSQDVSMEPQITQQTLPPSTPLFRPETQSTTISIPQPISQRTTLSVPSFSRQTTISVPPPISQQTTLAIPQPTPSQSTISVPQPVPEDLLLPQNPIRFDLSPLTQIIQRQPEVSRDVISQVPQTQSENRPNYILIYQQAPQYVQGEVMSASQEVPQITNPAPTTRSNVQPISSLPSSTTIPTFTSTIPPIFSSSQSSQPISSLQPIPSTARSTVIIQPSTISPSRSLPTTLSTLFRRDVDLVRAPNPICNNSGPSDFSRIPYPLKIRVVAPRGSITNLMIKPLTTTTKKPTTTRTRKPKKNTYESCVDGCKGNRKPICGIPLSTTVIDTNTLKGFPSVCHMACHNSYRKQAYEQLLEGRCSLLRTRIRTIDSNTKLKRDELNKAHYFVDNTEPHTIVEFSGALHK